VPEEPKLQGCPEDTMQCWDGSEVSRQPPNCEFEDCPPEPNCPANQYPGSDCSGECPETHECVQNVQSSCYVCASKIPNCPEWGMYPSRGDCSSKCFYPNWCESDQSIGAVCWKCLEPYDYR
jgi:hypothetical protein